MTNLATGVRGLNYYIFTGGKNPEGTSEAYDVYDFGAIVSAEGEVRDTAKYFAKNFYLNDEAIEGYKKMISYKTYESYVDSQGESNVRAALQVTNLFDYLLMTKRTEADEADTHGHNHAKINYADGKLAFYNINYSIKADEAEDAE